MVTDILFETQYPNYVNVNVAWVELQTDYQVWQIEIIIFYLNKLMRYCRVS